MLVKVVSVEKKAFLLLPPFFHSQGFTLEQKCNGHIFFTYCVYFKNHKKWNI